MAKIIVTRPGKWGSQPRNVSVFLDTKSRGFIQSGETLEFEISPGSHELFAKRYCHYSPAMEVDLREGETARFVCYSASNRLWESFIFPLFMLLGLFAFPWGLPVGVFFFRFDIPLFRRGLPDTAAGDR